MSWLALFSYFFGGVFVTNAIPHVVSGLMGRAFQSPFATPPGEGLSSSAVNVLWGFFNILVSYVLLSRVGAFTLNDARDAAAFGLGALIISLLLASHFGRINGGARPPRK
ncbi:hypothetical protein AA23498_2679 [Acetobacter nitrogenifigens DSM 23921 = NBRC 105050]|uniref:Major facilitator superfamily (MFS) profile domain-containing protein n=1 Tax=Acetobacter nitrogenifigens DSM 23921 = NBRC 105050 TaxID=1120919 RepID=A0A511XET5_9PROT|nr:hypothetical protein [Acetobacter nitrogenifigens]GBQ96594.1 hypothetical protein AA23498_2679 [Acetobacter nitrogenifigens DSM 23921 = NBRC 105050]GEN61411.1 hypothetical protein ANI02nite_32950 [Acetobacter nitrogenifigens DSM 23921 = NBRC 105050]